MIASSKSPTGETLDRAEVERFAAMADEWWDTQGKFKPLHRLNPGRLAYIRDEVCGHFERDPRELRCLDKLAVLDVGCGGGLLCEPLARLGARVTGIDPAKETIEAARQHASSQSLEIDYRTARVEDLAQAGETFDVVLVMEVVEHVPDVSAFLATCAATLRPGGRMILSTINRTLKSYALAIVGAEYILRWLPVGTHRWERFVTVEELRRALGSAGLDLVNATGLVYNPLSDDWLLAGDTDVNYLAAASFSKLSA
jgi:2-polyprenyl-6-hydroxyphenyl methylase/3-demethylubiquinone-9 3-methyltransferase